MARSALIWNTFNAGELSPLLDGRTDQEKYLAGCKHLRNFIPSSQGPVARRGGTRYLGAARNVLNAGTPWLLPFQFNQSQSYILEFTQNALRFWVNRGQLLSGMTPYEVVTPWTANDLVDDSGSFALRTAQSGDVMWIVNSALRPYKLSRLGATNWTVVPIEFANGPFEDVDPDSTVTVTSNNANAGPGTVVVLTATAPIFSAENIGSSFYVEQEGGGDVRSWGTSKIVAIGDARRWAGNYYRATQMGAATGGTGGGPAATGSNPPVHIEGRYWDGDGFTDVPNDNLGQLGVEWEYLHSGYGWVKITSIGGGGTTATGTVVRRLPGAIFLGTKRWAHPAFRASKGWPNDVTFFRERLCYARGRELFMSVTGSYDDFSRKDGPDITKETALNLTLTAATGNDSLQWIEAFGGSLAGGTAGNELTVRALSSGAAFAADNATHNPETEFGSSSLNPLRIGDALLFVTRAGRTLRELTIDSSSLESRLKAEDLTVLSEHILDAGVRAAAYQREPDSIAWFVLFDGTLAALTYNKERGVIAWAPHILGGLGANLGPAPNPAKVLSIACIPAPNNKRDDVWVAVQRRINGLAVHYIEVIEDNRLAELNTSDAFYGDCGVSYNGAPTIVIAGLGHLEGATVQVLADGSAHADRVVTAGQITLNHAASTVQIGFNSPAQLQTMRADGGAPDGTAQTRAKSIAEVWLRLDRTIGGKVGPSFTRLDPIASLSPALPIGTPPPLYSGDRKTEFSADYGTDGYICVEASSMLPMTLVAITARMEIND